MGVGGWMIANIPRRKKQSQTTKKTVRVFSVEDARSLSVALPRCPAAMTPPPHYVLLLLLVEEEGRRIPRRSFKIGRREKEASHRGSLHGPSPSMWSIQIHPPYPHAWGGTKRGSVFPTEHAIRRRVLDTTKERQKTKKKMKTIQRLLLSLAPPASLRHSSTQKPQKTLDTGT